MYGELNMNKLLLTMAKLIPAVRLGNKGTTTTTTTTTDSDEKVLELIARNFKTIMVSIVGPVISIIGVAGVIYLIMLGINYAKAEDADGRKKVQGRLIGAVVGAVIIIAGVTLCFSLDWATIFTSFTIAS
jgi:hypothetical protein